MPREHLYLHLSSSFVVRADEEIGEGAQVWCNISLCEVRTLCFRFRFRRYSSDAWQCACASSSISLEHWKSETSYWMSLKSHCRRGACIHLSVENYVSGIATEGLWCGSKSEHPANFKALWIDTHKYRQLWTLLGQDGKHAQSVSY
jgi:hypothetical protein